jgi:ubiquitin C-terminal hydrolase
MFLLSKNEIDLFQSFITSIKNSFKNEITNIGNTCYMIHLFFNLIPYLYTIKQLKIVLQKHSPNEINRR